MTTRLDRFTQKARAEPQLRFNALMGLVFDPEGLHESFARQDGKKAPGVDGIRKADYAEGLDARIAELSGGIRRMGYRPQPVRRTFIPKGDGRYRPLGIPTVVSYCTSYNTVSESGDVWIRGEFRTHSLSSRSFSGLSVIQ